MKKIILMPVLFVIMLSVSSCETGASSSSTTNPSTLINTAKQGTWRVTAYNDSGTDETSNFTGYNFTFGTSNALSTTNGTNTYTGTWSAASDDDDDNPSGIKFIITFASTSPADFLDLTDDWDVAAYSSTTIYLVDNSGGTDVLVFTKN